VLKLVRGGRVVALKSYTIKPGRTTGVTLRLKRAAFRQLKQANRLRFTLRLYMGHSKVVKSSTVTLREP
jgi:hypothetical protein